MSGTQRRRGLASYRDTVAERMNAGEAFGDVEDSIDRLAQVTMDEKAALAVRVLAPRSSRAAARRARPLGLAHLAMGDTRMNGRGRQRELGDAVAAALKQQPGVERYQARPRQLRLETAEPVEHPRPLEFDGNGFPIAQRIPSFVTRLARLLS
jgi:hypothetical protein